MIQPTNAPTRLRLLAAAGSILLGSTLMLVGGCESGSSGQGAQASPEERAASTPVQHEAYNKFGYRVEWRGFPVMTVGETIERLEPLGDVVAVQESGSTVTVLEARSGERRWSDSVGSTLTKYVGIIRDEKKLIVSSEVDMLSYDVDTGALLTKQRLAQVVNTKPAQVGPILVYGCSNGQVLGHLTLNGYRQWGSFLKGSVEVDPVHVGDDGTVALASAGGDVLILDGSTGLSRGRGRMFSGTDVDLATSDSAVYVASTDHSLYAFSKDRASELWRRRTDAPLKFAPGYHDGKVYCDLGTEGFSCLDANTGQTIWANNAVHGELVVVRQGRLIVWDGITATLLDPVRGAIVQAVYLEGVSHFKSDAPVDGNLYIASPQGVVAKLSPRN